MLVKKVVLKSIKDMPDYFSVDDAVERIILLGKIENAQTEIKEGKGLSTAQATKKLQKWLK
ncbi:MAG: hypothetical protein H7098_09460 [Oligoflexus sp.]|nr:hypothetical protein [Pseudopedobacter sp.]